MQVGGLIGLIFGIIFGLLGWYFGRKEAKKQRALDEVNDHIWQKSRSISWYVTLVTIYILLLFTLVGLTISSIKALSIILVVHLFSWGAVGAYLSNKMYSESKADNQLYKFLLGFFVLLGLTFIIVTIFFL